MRESKADITTYKKTDIGDITFPKNKLHAEIHAKINTSGSIFIPGGKNEYADHEVIILIRRKEGDQKGEA